MATPLPEARPSLLGTVLTSIATLGLSLIVTAVKTTPGLVAIVCGLVAVRAGAIWPGLAVTAVGALLYAEQCFRGPFTDCVRCHGAGHRRRRHRRQKAHTTRSTGWGRADRRDALDGAGDALALLMGGKPPKRCRHCRGRGVRMRWGRAVMNASRRAPYTPPTTPDPAALAGAADQAGPTSYAETVRRHLDRHPTASDK